MALRNQPYLPLYVQDFLTDEKLVECSPAATGIYIRLLCIMHKSDEYGTILLKQKDKQTDNQIKNFALKLVKHLPYKIEDIISGLVELVDENVLIIEDDKLIQKRMVRDNYISEVRSQAGKEGGKKSGFAKAKVKAKHKANGKANTEYENEYENEVVIDKLEKREENFLSEVYQFTQYPDKMLSDFCRYWTEKNKSRTKMRFETEKTFEINKRLTTWANRSKDYGTTKTIGADPGELAALTARKLGIE